MHKNIDLHLTKKLDKELLDKFIWVFYVLNVGNNIKSGEEIAIKLVTDILFIIRKMSAISTPNYYMRLKYIEYFF